MPSFTGRQHWGQALISLWQRFAVVVVVVAIVVLGGIGVGVYALVHGFGPTVGVWTQLQKTGAPPFEENGLAAYDPQAGRLIRCLGGPYSGTPVSTWAFDPQTYTWTQLSPSGPLPTSEALGLAYDETTGNIMRLGIITGQDEYDTWAYDASADTWTDLHPTMPPPPQGVDHRPGVVALAYDPGLAQVIMVGSTVTKVSTWAYDCQANSWRELVTNGSPPPRNQTACAYDKSMDRLLLFGGWGHFERAEGGPLGDTWAFDSSTNTWTELKPAKSPSARAGATMAYHDDTGGMILFGGSAGEWLADTWSYNSAKNTWTKLHTAGSPGPRGAAPMFYDATLRRLIMTGGQNNVPTTPMVPDCWAFSY
jgi:hypothetical protein